MRLKGIDVWNYVPVKGQPEKTRNSKALIHPEIWNAHHAKCVPGHATPNSASAIGLPSPADQRDQPSGKL